MPNPLTLATNTPTSTAKPESATHESDASKKTAQFQDILDQQEPAPEQDPMPEVTEEGADLPEAKIAADAPDIEAEPPAPTLAVAEVKPVPVAERAIEQAPPTGKMVQTQVTIGAQTVPQAVEAGTAAQATILHDPAPPKDVQAAVPQPDTRNNAPPNASPAITQVNIGTPVESAFAARSTNGPELSSKGQVTMHRDAPKIASDLPKSPQSQVPMDRPPSAAQMQILATATPREVEEPGPAEKPEALPVMADEPVLQSSRESAPSLSAPAQATRAEVARAIAGQMATAVQARPGSGAVEIALNPEELGRVSIVLNGRDDGFYVTIAAERPETLDLMRRHIAVLNAEFQKLGYGDLSFDLGTSSDPRQDARDPNTSGFVEMPSEEAAVHTNAIPQKSAPGRGIDMRL